MLDLCQAEGLKAILICGLHPALPDQPDWEKSVDRIVAEYGSHPALYGYFLTDEPHSSQFANLGKLTAYLAQKDPAHLPYINLFPNYATPEQLGNATYREHVRQFIAVVRPPLVSYDHYAVLLDGERPNYYENLEIVREEAFRAGVPFWQIVLSASHYGYRVPREDDLRWQAMTTLVYGAKGLSWFTYWNPSPSEFRQAIVGPQGELTEHWYMVGRVNREVLALGPTLLPLSSVGVYHTPPLPLGCRPLPEGQLLRAVIGAEAIIGFFSDQAGSNYAMLVNRSPRDDADLLVRFAPEVSSVEQVLAAGQTQPLRLTPTQAQPETRLRLRPGEGRLLRLHTRLPASTKEAR